MKFILGICYTSIVFISGWIFNFFFDVQFAFGLAVGWFLKQGYDEIATILKQLIN